MPEQPEARQRRTAPWAGSVYQPAGRTVLYIQFKDPSGRWVAKSTGLRAVAENWPKAHARLEAIRQANGGAEAPRTPAPTGMRRRGGSWGRRYRAEHHVGSCEACLWTPPTVLGAGVLHVHHVKPRSAGGDDSNGNLVALCPNCHATAHALLRARQRLSRADLIAELYKISVLAEA